MTDTTDTSTDSTDTTDGDSSGDTGAGVPSGSGLRPAPSPFEQAGPRSRTRTVVTRVAIALAASSVLVWVGAIAWGAFADYHPTGWMEDRRFPKAAEPICKAAMKQVLAFPPAHESRTPAERAAVIRESTAVIERMRSDLREVVPDGADARWINLWIDDWGLHVKDRLDFAERLETKGAGEEFFETPKAQTQISKSLDHFAEVNEMPSCTTPGDV